MDPRQTQTRQPPNSLLRPPPHHRPSGPSSSSSSPAIPRAPVTAHPTATISESSVFQGTHPISIGAGTIIHPRARIYSFDGPVIIGERCIISEKTTIGTAPTPAPAPGTGPSGPGSGSGHQHTTTSNVEGTPIRISSEVVIGPLVSIAPGVYIHSAVVVEAAVVLNKRVSVGAHSKICARCEIGANASIKEWMVVWGGSGAGLRTRKRATGKKVGAFAAAVGWEVAVAGTEAEDARLAVLQRDRIAVAKFIAPVGAGAGGRRR